MLLKQLKNVPCFSINFVAFTSRTDTILTGLICMIPNRGCKLAHYSVHRAVKSVPTHCLLSSELLL